MEHSPGNMVDSISNDDKMTMLGMIKAKLYAQVDEEYETKVETIRSKNSPSNTFRYLGHCYPKYAILNLTIPLKSAYHNEMDKMLDEYDDICECRFEINTYIRVGLNLCNVYSDMRLVFSDNILELLPTGLNLEKNTTLTDRQLNEFDHGGKGRLAVKRYILENILMFGG